MGREVRRVPADWKHPTAGRYSDGSVRYVSLFEGKDYERRVSEWDEGNAKWSQGLRDDGGDWKPIEEKYAGMPFSEWSGARPEAADYMPRWTDAEATHLMMYETCSEGSPISPAFATPEELARWLTDNEASAFAGMGATYEQWLRVCRGGFAPSAVIDNGVMRPGVALA